MIHRGNAFASMQRTYQSIEADYADLMDDSKTRAIIIDMDSPGGTVAGGFSALEFMRENKRKPVYVNVNERMLSGGLLLGSIADETAMLKTAHAGSLGVIVTHLNVAERMQRDGVKATMIFSGTHKADGHPYGDLPKEVQSRIQSDLDNTRQMFAEAVALGKPGISVDQLLSHEAQIFRGVDAVNAGLANVVTTSPTAYYRDIASRHRSGGGKSQSTATGATPEQTTTDEDAADDEPAATMPRRFSRKWKRSNAPRTHSRRTERSRRKRPPKSARPKSSATSSPSCGQSWRPVWQQCRTT
jgi:ClpP class serine protease